MKKLIIVAVTAALLAGCTAAKNAPFAQPASPLLTGPLTSDEWVHATIYSIQSNFNDADMFRGQKCNLVLNVTDSGKLASVKAQGGDPQLCEAAIAATKHAYLPPLPAGLPDEIPLMFELK